MIARLRVRGKTLPWMSIWLGGMSVGTCVSIIGLFFAFGDIGEQASAGQQAKDRQCRTYPISAKVYTDAQQRNVITADDLTTFTAGRPKDCP